MRMASVSFPLLRRLTFSDFCESMTDGPTYGCTEEPHNGPTDQEMDGPSYKDAMVHENKAQRPMMRPIGIKKV